METFIGLCYEKARRPERVSWMQVPFTVKFPLVGVGAPIHIFLPRVAAMLGTRAAHQQRRSGGQCPGSHCQPDRHPDPGAGEGGIQRGRSFWDSPFMKGQNGICSGITVRPWIWRKNLPERRCWRRSGAGEALKTRRCRWNSGRSAARAAIFPCCSKPLWKPRRSALSGCRKVLAHKEKLC